METTKKNPDLIIAIMRERRWLVGEPRTLREKLTSSVHYMMIRSGRSYVQIAADFKVDPRRYIRRKVTEGRWNFEELEHLAKIFDVNEHDLIQGYEHLAEMDDLDEL